MKIAQRITRKQLEILHEVGHLWKAKIELIDLCQQSPRRIQNGKCDCGKEPQIKAGEEDLELKSLEIKRRFRIIAKQAYPPWKKIKLEITPYKPSSKNETKSNIIPELKEDKIGKASFWLDYFEFPMTDSTYLSADERYSVILNEIDDDSAEITLIYFPGSYASLKDKSYYHQKAMQHLIKESKFLKKKDKD